MTLSLYIQDDIKAQISAGCELPFDLTLAGIAEYYGVSFTPVRAPVRGPIAEHYLRKERNGRLTLDRTSALIESPDPQVVKPTLPPDWREIVTRDVMLSSLRGDTSFLREEATATRYGVSRTVIRQVFNRLVGKGFLEHVPRAGWRVRRFDEADMCAYLEVREVLELKALALAQPNLKRTALQSMLAGNPVPQLGAPIQLDNCIHAYLIEKADNYFLRDFFERHGEYYMLLFEHAALEARVVAEMAEQPYLGTRHLIEKGYRRLGTLAGFPRLSTMREREAGFRRALVEAGLPVREEWIIHSPLSVEGGRQAVNELLALPEVPEGIFVNNNLLTLGVLLVLKERRARIPDDMALVGFDDHPWAAVTGPPLTTVCQPVRKLGQVAAQLLLETLAGTGPREGSQVLECELMVRQFC